MRVRAGPHTHVVRMNVRMREPFFAGWARFVQWSRYRTINEEERFAELEDADLPVQRPAR